MSDLLKEQLARLPAEPGVYQYFDKTNNLLYVGKAKDLSKRVKSYWTKTSRSPWTELLIQEVATIKTIVVKSEIEALMLENSLVKSLRPKYNIQLRDDKTFPFLRVSSEEFPLFSVTRKVKNDGARYFGPYLSATYLYSMLKQLQELFGIRTTSSKSYEARSNVPLQIGLGARNLDNKEQYNNQVTQAISFLSSPQPQMEKLIKEEMEKAAKEEAFERAAILRNRLQALQQLRQTQTLFSPDSVNADYVGIANSGKIASVYVLVERDGKITDKREFIFELNAAMTAEEQCSAVLDYIYINGIQIPRYIFISTKPNELSTLEDYLRDKTGSKVEIISPQRGDKHKRLQTAQENAEAQLKLEILKKGRRNAGLSSLMTILNLNSLPRRIEAFDISNLGPKHIVGASIVFIDGQPAKNEYRKYKIETPEGQNDFASMRELVFRRLVNKTRPLPDLLLIDGGKGQLSAAQDAQKQANATVPMISLAKREELIYLPKSSEPIALDHSSDALLLLTAIRDEVHRFVITFHRQRRNKDFIK